MANRRYHVRKGDQVVVLAGKEEGKKGKVLTVSHKKERAVVERLNFQKRHVRPGHPSAPQGGIIEREGSINLANLMLVCPKCQEQTRPKYLELESGTRIRVCRKCKEHID